MKLFQATKEKNALVDQTNLLLACNEVAGNAFIDGGRLEYLKVDRDDLAEWLQHTQIDRNVWRLSQPSTDQSELVCTSFSLMLWALLEQERLRQGILYPLAIARVRLTTHSMCAALTTEDEFILIEPQSDELLTVNQMFERGQEIQAITFQ